MMSVLEYAEDTQRTVEEILDKCSRTRNRGFG